MFEARGCGETERLLKFFDQGPSIEAVEKVDVAWRTTEDFEGQSTVPHVCTRGLLMRVSAIAKGELLDAVSSVLLAEEIRDCSIIVCGVLESLECIALAASFGYIAAVELLQEAGVVSRVGENCHASVVLCSCADEGDTADIDFLYRLWDCDVDLSNGVLERIQIAHDVVDFVDILVSKILLIRS